MSFYQRFSHSRECKWLVLKNPINNLKSSLSLTDWVQSLRNWVIGHRRSNDVPTSTTLVHHLMTGVCCAWVFRQVNNSPRVRQAGPAKLAAEMSPAMTVFCALEHVSADIVDNWASPHSLRDAHFLWALCGCPPTDIVFVETMQRSRTFKLRQSDSY